MTTPAPTPQDFNDLSTADLIKQINDEYAQVLAGERNTFAKAIEIGARLTVIQQRDEDNGPWKTRVPVLFPNMSYETAALYIRLHKKLDDLKAKAAAKGVSLTNMTITLARNLLKNPKGTGSGNKNKNTRAGAVAEPGDTKTNSPSTAPDAI